MIKLLYLMGGILLKQTVDEVKSLNVERVQNLKKRREEMLTYRPLMAAAPGSAEMMRSINQAQHYEVVKDDVRRLSKKILFHQSVPLIIYAFLTIVDIAAIIFLETTSFLVTE